MRVNEFTPGPWVWGRWTIFNVDRQAQQEGKPYWTLMGDNPDCLAQGPIGRKSMEPETIIETMGYECDGIYASEPDSLVLAAAPYLLAALEAIVAMPYAMVGGDKSDIYRFASKAISKAKGGGGEKI